MTIKAIYFYTDERGRPVLRKVRAEPGKHFSIQVARYVHDRIYWKSNYGALAKYQPDWTGRAMYNLPVLLDALTHHESVWFVEGERDSDTLSSLKKVATTTNYQGASAFTEEQAAWFGWGRSKSIINIVQDNDLAGSWALWHRYSTLVGGGVDKSRIRLWRPTGGAKDITDVFLCGSRRKPVERVGGSCGRSSRLRRRSSRSREAVPQETGRREPGDGLRVGP